MMGSDFYFRNKIPVIVLGVSEKIGKKLLKKLVSHPWYEIIALCDVNPRYTGLLYKEVAQASFLPEFIQDLPLQQCTPPLPCSLVFSCLNPADASEIEKLWIEAGYCMVSSTHDDLSGDAASMLLNAELLVVQGHIYW